MQFRNDDERAAWTSFAAPMGGDYREIANRADELLAERRKREADIAPRSFVPVVTQPPASDEAAKLADACDTYAARDNTIVGQTLRDAAALVRRLAARDDSAEIDKLRRELAAVTKAANLYQERADISDEYRSWLTRIGKAIGCGHLDERLPMCVIQELEKARQPSAIERFLVGLPQKAYHALSYTHDGDGEFYWRALYGAGSAGDAIRSCDADTPEAACAALLDKINAK